MENISGEYIRIWLRDAHALEEQADQLFTEQVQSFKDSEVLSEKLKAELVSITENKIILSIRIQQLGSGTSVIKDIAAKIIAKAKNIYAMANQDPVKRALTLHAITYMTIGICRVIIAAAAVAGDNETRRLCEQILNNLCSRARWIESAIADVTKLFLTDELS